MAGVAALALRGEQNEIDGQETVLSSVSSQYAGRSSPTKGGFLHFTRRPLGASPGQPWLVSWCKTLPYHSFSARCDAPASHGKHWEPRCLGARLFGSRRHQGRCAARHKQHRPWKSLERIGHWDFLLLHVQGLVHPSRSWAAPLSQRLALVVIVHRVNKSQESNQQLAGFCSRRQPCLSEPVRACLMCTVGGVCYPSPPLDRVA